jgi:hypothetical protein
LWNETKKKKKKPEARTTKSGGGKVSGFTLLHTAAAVVYCEGMCVCLLLARAAASVLPVFAQFVFCVCLGICIIDVEVKVLDILKNN